MSTLDMWGGAKKNDHNRQVLVDWRFWEYNMFNMFLDLPPVEQLQKPL